MFLFVQMQIGTKIIAARLKATSQETAPYLEQDPDITVLNPGSLSYPRQEGHKPSYMIITIDQDGAIDYHQKYVKNS